jgi:hypothetical protein
MPSLSEEVETGHGANDDLKVFSAPRGPVSEHVALNPHQGLSVGGGSKSEAGGAVWLRGGGKGMRYKIMANFHSA